MSVSSRWALLLLCGIAVTACAAPPVRPVMVDCRTLRLTPVTDSAQRLTFHSHGFSILPPQGEHWCISRADSNGIAFGKNLFGGKLLERPPRLNEMTHTFVAMAMAVTVEETKIETAADLQAFAERWDGGFRMVGSKIVLNSSPVPRFKVIDSKVTLAPRIGSFDCVRWEGVREERDNPQRRGFVLILTEYTWLCRHPHSSGLVLIGYSERHLQGDVLDSPLVETLKQEVEPFVGSLLVTPPR